MGSRSSRAAAAFDLAATRRSGGTQVRSRPLPQQTHTPNADSDGCRTPPLARSPRPHALPPCPAIAAHARVPPEPQGSRLDELFHCRCTDRIRDLRRLLSGRSRLVAGGGRASAGYRRASPRGVALPLLGTFPPPPPAAPARPPPPSSLLPPPPSLPPSPPPPPLL